VAPEKKEKKRGAKYVYSGVLVFFTVEKKRKDKDKEKNKVDRQSTIGIAHIGYGREKFGLPTICTGSRRCRRISH
jgi:hypothetical protein